MIVYKISIIIPCYSVGELFLNEAIKSIENQTYKNWEIILVDDCSPQEEYKSYYVQKLLKDNKLILIKNKENLGLGQSRNIGFDNSNGNLILFLDADDKYYNNNFFKYLIEKFKNNNELDLITFTSISFKEDSQNIEEEINKIEIKEKYYPKIEFNTFNNSVYKISSWSYCIKKNFLKEKNIRHLNKKTPHEDFCFTYQIIYHKPNLIDTNAIFYLYRKRERSITYFLSKKKYYEITNINIILDDINDLNLEKNSSYIYIYISRILLASLIKYGFKKNEKLLKIKINKKTYKNLCILSKNWNWWKINIIIKFKLRWIIFILYKIYYLFY